MNTRTVLQGRSIRAILFDLGHTLWAPADRETIALLTHTSYQQALALLRQFATLSSYNDDLPQQIAQAMFTNYKAYKAQHPGYEPDPVWKVQAALNDLDLPSLEHTACQALHDALHVPYAQSRVLFDDVHSTLAELQRCGYRLGIVTNRSWGGTLFLKDLETLHLLPYFPIPAIAVSEDLRICKPHPDIFRHTINALDIMPEEAAMVGDSLIDDINGAQRLNMFTVWKPNLSRRASIEADYRAQGLPLTDEILYTEYIQRMTQRSNEHASFYSPARPDVTITHISELLAFFPEGGM